MGGFVESGGSDGVAAHALRGLLHTDSLRPTGSIAETFPRDATANGSVLVSARLHFVSIHLDAGQVVTNETWHAGTTAAGTPLNQWACLYSSARAKLAVSDDATTAAWAADTPKTFTLTTPYTVPTSGLYYLGLCVVATTVPSLRSLASSAAINGIAPVRSGFADTGLTDPASAPATAAALTATTSVPYVYLS